jgi:GntR family transcriptional regulator of vanillate catabolism
MIGAERRCRHVFSHRLSPSRRICIQFFGLKAETRANRFALTGFCIQRIGAMPGGCKRRSDLQDGGAMPRTDRASQLEKAIQGLRSLLMDGSFDAGARLSETALADRLGISRTPLRQAMERLVAEGLLERVETGGCRVARLTRDDIVDAIEIRGVIEGTAARLAAERGVPPERLAEARAHLDRIDAALAAGPADAVDFDAYVHANAAFHEALAQLPGSAVIAREVARVCLLPLASPSSFLAGQEAIPDFRASLTRAQAQHRALLEAIENREGARAEALAREHARLARENLAYLTTRAEPDIAGRVPGLSLVQAS